MRGVGHLLCEEILGELGLFWRREALWRSNSGLLYLKGACEKGGQSCLQGPGRTGRGGMASS